MKTELPKGELYWINDDRGPKDPQAGESKNRIPTEKDPKPRVSDQKAPTPRGIDNKSVIKVSVGFSSVSG